MKPQKTQGIQKQEEGQPKGLWVLFSTEMAERFSFYGTTVLFSLFLGTALDKGGWGFGEGEPNKATGILKAALYLAGIPGGLIADRLVGLRAAIIWGGAMQCLGHFLLFFHDSSIVFLSGLYLLCIGTGLLKTNISSILGTLYSPKDKRRDEGFSKFYMGINVGAFLAPLIIGTIGQLVDYHYGFASAGVGMVFSLAVFLFGLKHLQPHPSQADIASKKYPQYGWVAIPVLAIAGVLVISICVMCQMSRETFFKVNGYLSPLLLLLIVAFFIYMYYETNERIYQDRILLTAIVLFTILVFNTLFNQGDNALVTYAEEFTAPVKCPEWLQKLLHTDKMPSTWQQAVNPAGVVILSMPVIYLWKTADKWFGKSNIMHKAGVGLCITAVSCLLIAACERSRLASSEKLAAPGWLVAIAIVNTLSELCINPLGLSFVTKAVPPRFRATMMGLFFAAISLSQFFGGVLGDATNPVKNPGAMSSAFYRIAVLVAVLGLICFLAAKRIMALGHGVEEEEK